MILTLYGGVMWVTYIDTYKNKYKYWFGQTKVKKIFKPLIYDDILPHMLNSNIFRINIYALRCFLKMLLTRPGMLFWYRKGQGTMLTQLWWLWSDWCKKNIFLPLSLSFQVSWNLLSQFQWYIATFFDPNSNIQCKTYNG